MVTETTKKGPIGNGKDRLRDGHRGVLAIAVGGGPAPGINGVISAASIEAINNGCKVLGIMEGFKWLSRGDISHVEPLTIRDVSRIHLRGGSLLRTSRTNPTKSPELLRSVLDALKRLDVKYLITIGGDDTCYTASQLDKMAGSALSTAHVPKTIDNDLPLPGMMPTFGYQTARYIGTNIVQSLSEDARTTGRWYVVVAMGRTAGHLALGIGKSAGATLTIIPEEFGTRPVTLNEICDILEGSIIKRLAMGRDFGVAILAEGLATRISEEELAEFGAVEHDDHGHIRLSEVNLGRVVKDLVRHRLEQRGIKLTIVNKDLGYELRSADPIPYDGEYTRDLGYGAVKFLLNGGTSALINIEGGVLKPIPFDQLLDPVTHRTRVREVDIHSESYEVALNYMIRLEPTDFEDEEQVARLAEAGSLTVEEFKKRFGHLNHPVVAPAS
jgi:6-phosphofructokinase 1